ncbi:MAG: CHAT domain-containing tetratricopeptide repeat protein [Acidobacteriota bacterium]
MSQPTFAAAALLCALLTTPTPPAAETLRLEPGTPALGALQGNDIAVYEARLPAEGTWILAVTADANQASVRVHEETGEDLVPRLAARTLYGLGWTEVLTFTVGGFDGPAGTVSRADAGLVTITLRSAERGAPVGSYALVLTPAPETTPQERRTLHTLRLQTQAAELFTQAVSVDAAPAVRRDLLRRAQNLLEDALDGERTHERRETELRTRMSLSAVHLTRDEPAHAARVLAQALPLTSPPALASTRALLLDRLGYAHLRQGDLDRARRMLEEAGALWHDETLPSGVLWTGTTLCLLELRQGEWHRARRCYEELLPVAGAAGDRWLVVKLETSLGGVYANLGEPELAIGSYDRALALARELGRGDDEATVSNNLGALYRALGEPEEAIALYQRALESYRGRGDTYWQARTLNNLGYAFLALGELDRAQAFLDEALTERRHAGDRRGEAITLRNLGRVAASRDHLTAAQSAFSQALTISRDLGDRRGEATGLLLLGSVLGRRGQVASARAQLDRALDLRRELGDRPGIAAVLLARGRTMLLANDHGEANRDFGEALELYRAIRDPVGQFEATVALARTARQHGDLRLARHQAEAAIPLLESLRIRIADPSRQASFLAARHGVFEVLIETLMTLHSADPTAGYAEAALEVNERARARTLLDLLEEPAVRDDRAISPELRDRWRTARRTLAAKAQRQLQVLGRGAVGADAETVASEVRDALTEVETVRAEIRRASPRFATLSAPQTLDAREIQRLLDPDTVLLEIALGAERSFLWLVTPDSVASFEIPGRKTLEALARQSHQELTQLDLRTRRTRRQVSQELAEQLLGPVLEHLETGVAPPRSVQRLVVVAEGALHYVPFAVLPLPGTEGDLVLDRFEVVHATSASSLAAMRQLLASKPKASRTAAVLADPVFHAHDPRVRSAPLASESHEPATRGLQPQTPAFERLPKSREEALSIAALAPPGEVLTLLDFEARRDRVLDGELADRAILHFATHAVLHPQNPELSGLLLSQVDAAGRPVQGFLRLHDLFGVELAADLVVLSACQSALGRELRGTGFVGLAQGFLHAGVPRVVASLWQVHDEANARLMTTFYRGLLREGKAPPAALREAQLALRADRRFADPFFWGAFVFQGDWR